MKAKSMYRFAFFVIAFHSSVFSQRVFAAI